MARRNTPTICISKGSGASTNDSTASKKHTKLPIIDRIELKDAIAGLKQLPDKSVDLIITDPPYNIASKNRQTIVRNKIVTTAESFGAWDIMHPFDHEVLILQLISQAYRVLKQGGSFYLFTAREDNGYYIRKAKERGFTSRNQIAIVKTPAMLSIYKNAWRSGFELCMFLTKGRLGAFHFPGHADAVNVYKHRICDKKTKHPTEKPLELIKKFVSVSSNPGDLVVDPFMGSGTTAVACKGLGRRYLGFDTSQEYIKMARKRLKESHTVKRSIKISSIKRCS